MITRRTLLVAVALAAVGAVLVPTMAASLDVTANGGDRITTPSNEDIVMTPADGPNGIYAYLNENDEVAMEIGEGTQERAAELGGEGVNDDAVTDIDDIFHVTYTGDEDEGWKLKITTEIEDVQFYYGGDPGNSLADETHFDADETVAVGVSVDATGDGSAAEIEGLEEFTVHAYAPASDEGEGYEGGDAVGGGDGDEGDGYDDGDGHDADETSDESTPDADGEATETETATDDGDNSGVEEDSDGVSDGPGSDDGDGSGSGDGDGPGSGDGGDRPTDEETDDTTEHTTETDGGGLTQDGLTEPVGVAESVDSSGFPLLLLLLIILLGLGVTFLARQMM